MQTTFRDANCSINGDAKFKFYFENRDSVVITNFFWKRTPYACLQDTVGLHYEDIQYIFHPGNRLSPLFSRNNLTSTGFISCNMTSEISRTDLTDLNPPRPFTFR